MSLAVRFQLSLVLLASLAACAQIEDVSTVEGAACAAQPTAEEVARMTATWAELQRPAMVTAGLDARAQQVMSRRFALMALGSGDEEVACCDDYLGCTSGVNKSACVAHLSLLGCKEGYEPACEGDECYCAGTC
ncbi:MAG TPA: hypothetical protein VKZ63_08270 [Kofleriaceae bacterium]|nr:hypothetical protein [Kofleriaceae bacterium]